MSKTLSFRSVAFEQGVTRAKNDLRQVGRYLENRIAQMGRDVDIHTDARRALAARFRVNRGLLIIGGLTLLLLSCQIAALFGPGQSNTDNSSVFESRTPKVAYALTSTLPVSTARATEALPGVFPSSTRAGVVTTPRNFDTPTRTPTALASPTATRPGDIPRPSPSVTRTRTLLPTATSIDTPTIMPTSARTATPTSTKPLDTPTAKPAPTLSGLAQELISRCGLDKIMGCVKKDTKILLRFFSWSTDIEQSVMWGAPDKNGPAVDGKCPTGTTAVDVTGGSVWWNGGSEDTPQILSQAPIVCRLP